MIRHVVTFRFVDDVDPAAVAALAAGLDALPAAIAEVVAFTHGADLGLADGNSHYGVVADFADRAAYEAYRDHPGHQAVIVERLRPILAERVAIQFEVP